MSRPRIAPALFLVVVVGAAVLVATSLAADSSGRDADLRLPDLRQVVPSGLVTRSAPGGRVVLAFSSAVENIGKGPLLVRGQRETGELRMRADQLVERADGTRIARRGIGKLGFFPGGHNHWHFMGFQRFELRDTAGKRVARDHKTGFCLGDRFPSKRPVPGTSKSPVINHNCSRGLRGTTRLLMGIAPGWGDDYAAYLEDQFVEITGVSPGRYVLVHRADPSEVLQVADDRSDDVAGVLIELGKPGRNGLPTVRVLKGCPGRDGSPQLPCAD